MSESALGPQFSQTAISRKSALKAAALAGAGLAGLGIASEAQARQSPMHTRKAIQLSQTMRKLWEEHITWTRLFIVSFAANLPDANPTAARLLRNQVDIGNAIKPFYGPAAGNKLTQLLKQHILGAVAILKAAKSGNTTQEQAAIKAWYANADQIAAFLHQANPTHWPLGDVRRMMHNHLTLTLHESVHRLTGKYQQDIADFDRVEKEILGMADTLSRGIVAQFPNRFM